MRYLADTVTLVRYFTGTGKLSSLAMSILESADAGEHEINVSIFTFVEIMYLSEKKRILINLDQAIEKIINSKNYNIVNLSLEILKTSELFKDLELHDRLIVATAKHMQIPVITCDQEIINHKAIETVWV